MSEKKSMTKEELDQMMLALIPEGIQQETTFMAVTLAKQRMIADTEGFEKQVRLMFRETMMHYILQGQQRLEEAKVKTIFGGVAALDGEPKGDEQAMESMNDMAAFCIAMHLAASMDEDAEAISNTWAAKWAADSIESLGKVEEELRTGIKPEHLAKMDAIVEKGQAARKAKAN